jgi:predicted DNA-binding protein YlxM (UPF0122 family)
MINEYFGTKTSTLTNKSTQINRARIKDMFKLDYYNRDFSIRHITENNSFSKMVVIDGMIVSLDALPENLQENRK